MEIHVASERVLLVPDQCTVQEAEKKAWDKKLIAFDALSQVTSFLAKPKDDEFTLLYQEHRYQPFWHVCARARYVYDRNSTYQVPVEAKEVNSITLHKTEYEVANGHIHIPVLEHCAQEEFDEVYIDGVTGKSIAGVKPYISVSPKEIKGKLEQSVPKQAVLVPPQVRVSAIMRDSLSKMIKGIQADSILEEQVEVTSVDLYYRPIYAFQFQWKTKNKEGIVEIDAITGEAKTGNKTFREYIGKALDLNFLFDIGADAAGMIVPGGSIAVKVAKKYIDVKKT